MLVFTNVSCVYCHTVIHCIQFNLAYFLFRNWNIMRLQPNHLHVTNKISIMPIIILSIPFQSLLWIPKIHSHVFALFAFNLYAIWRWRKKGKCQILTSGKSFYRKNNVKATEREKNERRVLCIQQTHTHTQSEQQKDLSTWLLYIKLIIDNI